MFHLCLVILPDQPDGAKVIPVAKTIFQTLGDADCRTAYVIPSTAAIARRILEDEADKALVLLDPDKAFVKALGLRTLPALVHLRQDSTVVSAVEGWDRAAWQQTANGVACHGVEHARGSKTCERRHRLGSHRPLNPTEGDGIAANPFISWSNVPTFV